MDFVDLDRHFAPIHKDQDAVVDWGAHFGRRYGGWLSWSDLLTYRRVVLLAEALSGKTEELKHRADQLKCQRLPAFFVRIEDLGTRGFRAAIDPDDIAQFETWKAASSGDAWFFLDSVDEARLNGTVLETALREFRRELDRTNLNRAYVIISCRVSDWKGKADRNALQSELPFEEIRNSEPSPLDRDEILLGPIFEKNARQTTTRPDEPKHQPSKLLVVQITPLSDEQRGKMAKSVGIDAQKFVDAIDRSGLHTMAERPGDLIDLIGYWKTHKQFGSLLDMTEEGVRRKLREEDPYRPAAGILSPDEARSGAERLAAALVLCKTFSLRASGQEPDSALSEGAIDPSAVLGDWDSDKVNALVRTGLFAPGTFGRVRFHQRTTQEYLAACWLRSLSSANCPDFELRRLLFAEPYGEQTVVASLAPVAAWLAHWIPFVRDTLIERDPTALIVHGDPRSLSIKVREDLLDSYAKLDAAGKLDAPHVDYRAAWMFSSQDLGDAINRCWNVNSRSHFRLQLLHFIEEGRIKSCLKLARAATLDHAEDQYVRLLGVRALAACEDTVGLRELAKQVRDEPSRFSARFAPEVAIRLFPTYIDTPALLQLITHSQQPDSRSSEGFASHLADLYRQAPNRKARILLVSSVTSMVATSQHSGDTGNLAPRSAKLTEGLAELAKADLDELGSAEIEAATVSLLMAVERATRSVGDTDVLGTLRKLVRSNKALNC